MSENLLSVTELGDGKISTELDHAAGLACQHRIFSTEFSDAVSE